MNLPTYFDEFRTNTQPNELQRTVMIEEHTKLRELLAKAPELKKVLLGTFIQGSQRRATALKGSAAHPCDVDVVAVMDLERSTYSAAYAHELFHPFLERHYSGKYETQERSWCIKAHAEVTIDLVPTSEPDSDELREVVRSNKALRDWTPTFQQLTEAFTEEATAVSDWDRTQPLWIPDRKLLKWEHTHPLYLIAWTAKKNAACNGRFTHVAKAVKWWKREIQATPKYPKGYPLEHLVAECCPDGIKTVADGLTQTLERIASTYREHAARKQTPFLQARGITEPQNVMKRLLGEDFAAFHSHVESAARLARAALECADTRESAGLWQKLLGSEFPNPPETASIGTSAAGYTPREKPTRLSEGRYA